MPILYFSAKAAVYLAIFVGLALGAFLLAKAVPAIWRIILLNSKAPVEKVATCARRLNSENFHLALLLILSIAFVSRSVLLPSGHWSEETWLGIHGEIARAEGKAPAMHHTWYSTVFLYTLFAEILSPFNLGLLINARIVTAALFSIAPIFIYLFSLREGILNKERAFLASAFMYFLPLVSNYATFGVWPELIAAFFVCMFLFAFSVTKNPLILGLVAGVGVCSKLIFLYFLIPFSIFYFSERKLGLKWQAAFWASSLAVVGVEIAFGRINSGGLNAIVDFSVIRDYAIERFSVFLRGGYFLDAFNEPSQRAALTFLQYALLALAAFSGALSKDGKERALFFAWMGSVLMLFLPVAWVVPGHLIPTAQLFSVLVFSALKGNRPFLMLSSAIVLMMLLTAFSKMDVRRGPLMEVAYGSVPVEGYMAENLKSEGRRIVLFDPDFSFCFELPWSRKIFKNTVFKSSVGKGFSIVPPKEGEFGYKSEIFVLPSRHYSGNVRSEERETVENLLRTKALLVYEGREGARFKVFAPNTIPV